jgi:hypothetical protein
MALPLRLLYERQGDPCYVALCIAIDCGATLLTFLNDQGEPHATLLDASAWLDEPAPQISVLRQALRGRTEIDEGSKDLPWIT